MRKPCFCGYKLLNNDPPIIFVARHYLKTNQSCVVVVWFRMHCTSLYTSFPILLTNYTTCLSFSQHNNHIHSINQPIKQNVSHCSYSHHSLLWRHTNYMRCGGNPKITERQPICSKRVEHPQIINRFLNVWKLDARHMRKRWWEMKLLRWDWVQCKCVVVTVGDNIHVDLKIM